MTPATITELRRQGRRVRVVTNGHKFAVKIGKASALSVYLFASEWSIWHPTRAEATTAARAWLAGVKG